MSLLGSIIRGTVRPMLRVGEQLRESSARLQQMRRRQQVEVEQQDRLKRMQGQADSAARFEQLYEDNGWDEASLAQQLVAVRRTKIAALVASCIASLAGVAVLLAAPLWMLVILVPAVAGLAALGLAKAIQFALFQAQIEGRRLISLREYLCRPDMLAHLTGRRP